MSPLENLPQSPTLMGFLSQPSTTPPCPLLDIDQGYNGPETGDWGQGNKPWTRKKIVLQGQGFKPWTYQKDHAYDHAHDHSYDHSYGHAYNCKN